MSEEKKDAVVEEQPQIPAAEEPSTNPPVEEIAEAAKEETPKEEKKEEEKIVEVSAPYEEVIVKLEDISEEKEYPEAEMETLTRLYNQTMNKITEGEIVSGRILNVTDTNVIIDIGFKSEGLVSVEEFENLEELKPGDEVEVFLETMESADGQLSLSRKRADFIRVWEGLVEKYENDEVIPGTITRRIKGGMVVNLTGVDAFLPGSQIDVKPIRDFDGYLGRELNFKIVKVNHARKNIVVSSRVLIEKAMESQRNEILSSIEKGQIRKGSVKNITDFGVFIDLGGVDGLLHITDLSWGRVNHPSELVKLDQDIDVMILDFNEQKDRISLGLKQLQPHPWENVGDKFPVGAHIDGRVVSITDYGAFVELEKGIEGLVHISEMSWSQHIKHPSQILSVGQGIEAVVLNIEADAKKISLGLKQLEPDPWEEIEDRFPVGSVHKGVVRNLTQFGAFVELEEGIDGLVHISDLSWTKKVRHPSEIVKKSDEIEVVVLGINREERRIALGHKQIEDNPWDSFEENYSISTETSGRISRIIDKGIIVTLPLGVDGFIPNQHLGLPKGKKVNEVFEEGAEVPAKVIEFDKENKKIVLSVSGFFKDKERKDYEDYMTTQGATKTTMGDVATIKEAVPPVAEEASEKEVEKAEKPAEAKPADEKKSEKKEEVKPEPEPEVEPVAEKAEEAQPEKETKEEPKVKKEKKPAKKTTKKAKKEEEPAAESETKEKAEEAAKK